MIEEVSKVAIMSRKEKVVTINIVFSKLASVFLDLQVTR